MFNDSLHEWPLTFCGLKCYCSFIKSQYANDSLKIPKFNLKDFKNYTLHLMYVLKTLKKHR